MSEKQKVVLELTREQEALLRHSLCRLASWVKQSYGYELDDNAFYDDLTNQVYANTRTKYFDYEPWRSGRSF